MKIIAVIGGTLYSLALLGQGGEMWRELPTAGQCQITHSVPLSVLDQLQPIAVMEDVFTDYMPLIERVQYTRMRKGAVAHSRIAILASSRCPRDCLTQFQCPIGNLRNVK